MLTCKMRRKRAADWFGKPKCLVYKENKKGEGGRCSEKANITACQCHPDKISIYLGYCPPAPLKRRAETEK